ncbi:MAG TPA: glycosyltransferase family 39 protein, partial [Bacillota bacterium]|nr:glycosyltransferase family 39 protein [Bacillota bacterium]
MNFNNEQLNRKELIIWGILFFLEIIMLWVGITHEGVWYDEACSVGIIRHPLSEIWQVVKSDVHPPLYFFMLKLFTSLFGPSVLAMRSLSALGILAVFLLGFGPVRRACGKKVGFWFSFLVMAPPIYLEEAQEIRMYTWAIFFVTGSLLYAYLAMAERKNRDWILFGVFMLAALYTHYYGLMAMVVL